MVRNYTLGLNIGKVDPSATLFQGPKIIAHIEEERYTRVKKAIGQFPVNAIKHCLNRLVNGLEDVSAIVLGFDHDKFTLEVPLYYLEEWGKYPNKPASAAKYEINRLKEKNPLNVQKKIYHQLESAGMIKNKYYPEIKWYSHHYCHAISSHLSSPFQNSLGVVVDANSEIDTISVWNCQGTNFKKIYSKPLPHSMGWLYRAFTLLCGFDAYEGEGMLMGLAPYGKPNKKIAEKIEKIIYWKTDNGEFDFGINCEYVYLDKLSKENPNLSQRLIDEFGAPNSDSFNPPQYFKDLAYEIQDRFEKTLQQFVQRFINKTGHKYLSLSGGVFLNCKVTGHIWRETDGIEDIYIVPNAGDDGIGIGSCMAHAIENGYSNKNDFILKDVYLGDSFTEEKILASLENFNIRNDFKNDKQYESLVHSLNLKLTAQTLKKNIKNKKTYDELQKKVRGFIANKKIVNKENIAEFAADKIFNGKVVGWFQGRMEAGPRALGNRSILADPRSIDSLLKVNEKVKFRQPWRPFCPSVMHEYAEQYFNKPTQCPYMINTFEVTEKCEKESPAIVHVDKTARPQFLIKEHNPKYYNLLKNFYIKSGVPIIMNTSMNIKGEPICRTPEDALNFFFATDVDLLVIGNYALEK